MESVDAQIHGTHRGLEKLVAIMDAMGVSAAVLDDWPPTRYKLPSGITRYEFPFSEEAVNAFRRASLTLCASTPTTRR
jgi:hypothetical protein